MKARYKRVIKGVINANELIPMRKAADGTWYELKGF